MASVTDPFDQARIPLKPLPYANRANAHTDELIVDYGTPESKYHIYIADSIDPSHLIDITQLIIQEMINDASINANNFEVNLDGLNNDGDTIPFKLREILNRIYKQYIFPDNQEGFDYERDADKAFNGTGKVILLTDEHGNVLFPVTTADAIYDSSGISIQERLDNMTRFAMTVRYIYADSQDQTMFEFDYPFKNYPDGGNFMEVRIGTTYVDKSRYAIQDIRDNNNDIIRANLTFIQGDKIERGRRIDLLFIYNTPSLSSARPSAVDGSIFISNSIPISKMEKYTSNYLINDPSSIATSAALYNLYMDLAATISESNSQNFWFRDSWEYQINPLCVIENRNVREGDLFHIVFANPKSRNIKIRTTGSVIDGTPNIISYPVRLASDQDAIDASEDENYKGPSFDYVANRVYKFLFRNHTFYLLNPVSEDAILRTNYTYVELQDQQTEVSYEGLYGIEAIRKFTGPNLEDFTDYNFGNKLQVWRNNLRLFEGIDYTYNIGENSIHLFVRGEEHERIMFEVITAENINGEIVIEYHDPRQKADINRDGIIYEPGTDRVVVLPGSPCYTTATSQIPPNVNNADQDPLYDYYNIISSTLDLSHEDVYDPENDVVMFEDDFDTSEIYNAAYNWLDEHPDANIFVGPWNVLANNNYVASINGETGEIILNAGNVGAVDELEFKTQIGAITNKLESHHTEITAHHIAISNLEKDLEDSIGKPIDDVPDDVLWSGEEYLKNSALLLSSGISIDSVYDYDYIDIYYRSTVLNESKIATVNLAEENQLNKELSFNSINPENNSYTVYKAVLDLHNLTSIIITETSKWECNGTSTSSSATLTRNELCIYKVCGRNRKNILSDKKTIVNNIDDVSTTSAITLQCIGVRGQIDENAIQSINTYNNLLYVYNGAGKFYKINPTPDTNGNVVTDTYDLIDPINKGNGFACDGRYFYLNSSDNKIYKLLPDKSTPEAVYTLTNTSVNVYGLDYGIIDDEIGPKLYAYSSNENSIDIYEINLNDRALKAYTTNIGTINVDRASRLCQDFIIYNYELYLCGDYPSKIVRIAFDKNDNDELTPYIKHVYTYNKYCDNGILAGEIEGLTVYNDQIISAHGYTNCVPSNFTFDFAQNGDDSGFKLKRTMVFGVFDPSQSYINYNRELRGGTAFQDIDRYIDANTNTWLPTGEKNNPYPSVVLATNVKKDPGIGYRYRIVKPESDSNGNPQVLLFNQHDIDIVLEAQSKTTKFYFYKCTNVNIHVKSKIEIVYLIDSTVNYFSSSDYCAGVYYYNAGYCRFNAVNVMGGDFAKWSTDFKSAPNGNYIYKHSGDTYLMPARKSFKVQAKANGKTYNGFGMSDTSNFRIPMSSADGMIATGVFTYDNTVKMCKLETIIMQDGTRYTGSQLSELSITVNMN